MRIVTYIFATLVLLGCARTTVPSNEIRSKAKVYIFVGVDCPISNSYAPEINRIISEYSNRDIAFYLVYPDASITMAQTTEHAKTFNYNCPILLDANHALAKRFGVTVTVEAAVVSK